MFNENFCPARDPQNGPCPQRCIDHHECLGGDHGCEHLGEKAWIQALSEHQTKKMTPEEEAEFQIAAQTAGLPCGKKIVT